MYKSMKSIFALIIALYFLTPAYAMADKTDDIRVITDRLPFGKIALEPYEGDRDDFDYLREYITKLAVNSYQVSPDTFDHPTLLSTTLLRDLVSKMNSQQPLEHRFDVLVKDRKTKWKIRKDIAEMWRYPSWGYCGHVSWALYNIYKSFGYKTDRIDSVNGSKEKYDVSHVMTDVYVDDLKKYVMQDPTYNFYVEDKNGIVLSFDELQTIAQTKAETPVFKVLLLSILAPYTGQTFMGFPQDADDIPEKYRTRLNLDYFFNNYYNSVFKRTRFDGEKETTDK